MKTLRSPSRQAGMSIIAAIFIMTLLALIAASMVRLVSTASVDSVLDLEGSRTYQAARAGVEWGLFQLDPNATTATLPDCFSEETKNAVPGYKIVVNCTRLPAVGVYQEGTRQFHVYRIQAVATSLAQFPVPVEREIVATVEKCRDSTITVAPYDC